MVGKYLRVVVSSTDSLGGTGTFTATTTAVANVDDATTGSISITGTVEEGGHLETDTSSLADVDGSLAFTYQWKYSTDNSTFSDISGETSVDYDIPFDQSMVGKYLQVVVSSTDSLGGTGTFTATTAAVANVNDAPTNLTLSQNTVDENVSVGSTIGTFNTTDPDTAYTADTFTYTFHTDTPVDSIDTFEIDGNALKTKVLLDYETTTSYTIKITSTDNSGLSIDMDFTISINDVEEAPHLIKNHWDFRSFKYP